MDHFGTGAIQTNRRYLVYYLNIMFQSLIPKGSLWEKCDLNQLNL
ncbi:MAG: hypothetical protein NZ923_07345 [Candidatus Kryptonium sp.]|nr:hypothetical protein [Candidatus Kryptonium sp.]